MNGTLTFKGNPWPDGHLLSGFRLAVVLHEPTVSHEAIASLDLRFTTEAYHYPQGLDEVGAAAGAQSDFVDDWEAIGVWLNFKNAHATALATHEDLELATPEEPFELNSFDHFVRTIDPLDEIDTQDYDYQDALAFQSHILGWDSLADHKVSITRDAGATHYNITWTGKVARTYAGRLEFEHEFDLQVTDVEFSGFCGHQFGWHQSEPVTLEQRELRLRAVAERLVADASALTFEPGVHHEDDRLMPRAQD